MIRRVVPLTVLLAIASLACGCGGTSVGRTTDTASVDQVPLTDQQLRDHIDDALNFTEYQRQLDSQRHAAWQILHGVLAFGRNFPIQSDGKTVNTLDWVLGGGKMSGWTMRRGDVGLKAVLEAGSKAGQGHEDQWLAIIAQADLPADQPILIGQDKYTIADLVRQAQHDVVEGKECSWTLIGLSHYLPDIDATWQAGDNSTWSIERIMAMEAGAGMDEERSHEQITGGAPCGGSHRLIGMTMALARYRQQHPNTPLAGGWAAAQDQIDWAIDTAREFQLPSGAFSVNYFGRSTNSVDLAEHLGSTGHTLEFLSLALDDDEIKEPWVARAATFLCDVFKKTKPIELECGAMYHAAHGLVLYRQRRFGPRPSKKAP